MRSKYEALAQKELEAEGWRVDNKAGMGRWSKNRDYFNQWDLLAVKRGEPLRFISIKGHQGIPPEHRKDVSEFWLPDCCVKEIWWFTRSKVTPGWRKIVIS